MYLESYLEKLAILTAEHTGEKKKKMQKPERKQKKLLNENELRPMKGKGVCHRDSLYRVARGEGVKLEW